MAILIARKIPTIPVLSYVNMYDIVNFEEKNYFENWVKPRTAWIMSLDFLKWNHLIDFEGLKNVIQLLNLLEIDFQKLCQW